MSAIDAVFVISFGGPEKMDDVMPFLENVTRGRNIPRSRLEDVAHHYALFNGRSPINEITRQQAACLQQVLSQTDTPWPVYIGQKNWDPYIEDTLRKMMADGVKKAIGFITAAHRSLSSLESYVTAVETARQKIGPQAPAIDYVGPWFDHPLFLQTITERIQDVKAPADAAWVFTAHSIPCGMAKESTYVEELRKTADLVTRLLGQKEWSLAYTSRSGNPADAWLEPDISDWMREKAKTGIRNVLAIPIGFVADHVEVLYDLDIEAKQTADTLGLRLYRAKTVGDHPLFCRLMADVVRARAQSSALPEQTAAATTLFRDGSRGAKVGRGSSICFCFPGSAEPPCTKAPATTGRPR